MYVCMYVWSLSRRSSACLYHMSVTSPPVMYNLSQSLTASLSLPVSFIKAPYGFGHAIEELDLEDNDIYEDGGIRLAQALSLPHVLPRLKCLILSFNHLKVEGMRAIIQALRERLSWPTTRLHKVFLYQNDVPTHEIGRVRGMAWAPTRSELDHKPTPSSLHHNLYL